MTTPSWDDVQRIAQARAIKAAKIVAVIEAGGENADLAAHLTTEQRHEVEKHAGTRTKSGHWASDETWRVVVEMLAASSRARALCPTCGLGNPAGPVGPRLPHGHQGECTR